MVSSVFILQLDWAAPRQGTCEPVICKNLEGKDALHSKSGSQATYWGVEGAVRMLQKHTPKGPGWRIWLPKGAVSHSSCERCPLAAGQTLASLQVYTAPAALAPVCGGTVGPAGCGGWVPESDCGGQDLKAGRGAQAETFQVESGIWAPAPGAGRGCAWAFRTAHHPH